MTIIVTTPPLAEPLTLAEIKAHLRIDGSEEDVLLAQLASVARDHLEGTTGLVLIAQQMRLCLDAWPRCGIAEIARGPVRSIDEVRTYDATGAETVLDLSGRVLDGSARPARLWLPRRPTTGQALNGIEIDFTAGFGESGTDVPDGLKRAMLTHVALMFEFRGAVPVGMQPAAIPDGYDRLVAPFLMRRL